MNLHVVNVDVAVIVVSELIVYKNAKRYATTLLLRYRSNHILNIHSMPHSVSMRNR